MNYVHHPRTWNFFRGRCHATASCSMSDNSFFISNLTEGPILTTNDFPPDLDTTSVGLMITQPDDNVFDSVMNEMLEYTNSDNIMMVS